MLWTSENHYLDAIAPALKYLTDNDWVIFSIIPRGDNMCTVIAYKD